MKKIDISTLLKEATAISREQGYLKAVEFLKKLIDKCLRLETKETGWETQYCEGGYRLTFINDNANKAYYLSQSLNKIRSYMQSVETISDDEIIIYLKSIIKQLPSNYAYFDVHLVYVGYLLSLKKIDDAMRALQTAQLLLNPYMPRHDYLRKQGMFHNCMIEISSQTKSKSAHLDYLYHIFISFCIEVALAYDISTRHDGASDHIILTFTKRSSLDISKSRCLDFFDNEKFDECLKIFGIYGKKKELINEYCQFYSKGLYETLNKRFTSQLDRYYKIISESEFPNYNDLPQIDDEIFIIDNEINKILKKYIVEIK